MISSEDLASHLISPLNKVKRGNWRFFCLYNPNTGKASRGVGHSGTTAHYDAKNKNDSKLLWHSYPPPRLSDQALEAHFRPLSKVHQDEDQVITPLSVLAHISIPLRANSRLS